MNDIKRTTLSDRFRNAIRGFKGKPIDILYLGVDVKRCCECEYKNDRALRDDLLVTAGARAAYMENLGCIELPSGVEGETKLAKFISHTVDRFLYQKVLDTSYDIFIENALANEYGPKKGEQ